MKTQTVVFIAVGTTAAAVGGGYYLYKEYLINAIMEKYGKTPSFDAPRQAFYKYNIFELRSLLNNINSVA